MVDIKNVLEVINEIVVVPVAVITFIALMYLVIYLWKKDPDVLRSRIFLKYREFKQAFLLLAVFAFILLLHVSLIYIPHVYKFEDYPLIEDVQKFFGLALVVIMVGFVSYLYRSFR